MMNTFIELPTPITRIANGSSAGGGIARRNSTIGAAPRRARRETPSSSPAPIADDHGDREAEAHAHEARHDVAAHALEQPRVGERGQDVGQRREVVGVAAGRRRPHSDQHEDRHGDLEPGREQAPARSSCAAPRAARDASAARGARPRTKIALSSRPSTPVVMISAYISSSLPPERATLIARPRPADADHELGRDRQDQRHRGGDPQAGGDVGHGARQRHAEQPLARARSRTSGRCRWPPGRRPARRRALPRAAARTTRTRPGRPCSAARCRRSGSPAGSARPRGSGAGTRSAPRVAR